MATQSDAQEILTKAPAEVLDSRMTVTHAVGHVKTTYSGSVRALLACGLLGPERLAIADNGVRFASRREALS